jgi:hypothetical protein
MGDPPHPVQASLITASIFGLRFLCTLLFAFSATAIFNALGEIDQCTYFTKNGSDVYQIPDPLASF